MHQTFYSNLFWRGVRGKELGAYLNKGRKLEYAPGHVESPQAYPCPPSSWGRVHRHRNETG